MQVAYSRLDPVRLVEWFEYMKLVGVSKVLTFYNSLHPDSMNVFKYYISTGFLELISYKPRSIKGITEINFTDDNSQTRQARQDKTLLVRDCQFRLGGYDYVMTIDFDEFPVPIAPYGTLNWIIQATRGVINDAVTCSDANGDCDFSLRLQESVTPEGVAPIYQKTEFNFSQ
uniref:Glycosyltransferase family 92 protein n=1 Tax=Biomphalaria glabrata TaxID=6526 RepID=A0A2C9LFU3_BIOGL